jgi:hypothetical protein
MFTWLRLLCESIAEARMEQVKARMKHQFPYWD